MIERERLQQCAAAYGVDVDNRAAEKLDRYAELLVEWNQKMTYRHHRSRGHPAQTFRGQPDGAALSVTPPPALK